MDFKANDLLRYDRHPCLSSRLPQQCKSTSCCRRASYQPAISSMTVTSQLLDLIQSAKVYDLAQSYFIGMPHHPVHPPYLFGLVKKHGEFVSSIGASSASEALALGAHVGTHIDALCHFSNAGKLCDGGEIAQSYTGGIERLSVDTIAPIFRRGGLLDIARLEHTDVLPIDFLITPEHLDAAARAEGVQVGTGDVVLLRTACAPYSAHA